MVLLLLALLTLAFGALFTWRLFGNDVSGRSLAEESIRSGPNPQVLISNPRGTVRVEGVPNLEAIEFEVTKYALAADRDRARQRASEVRSDISREDSTFVVSTRGGRETGAKYTVRVPAGGSVEVEAEAGNVSVTGMEGEVTVRAEAGDVTVGETRGSVYVEARRGDARISGVRTDAGRVEAEVGVGDLEANDLVVGTLDTFVDTGNVVLSGRFSGDGAILVQTGDIFVGVPAEDVAELELEALVGEVVRENGDR